MQITILYKVIQIPFHLTHTLVQTEYILSRSSKEEFEIIYQSPLYYSLKGHTKMVFIVHKKREREKIYNAVRNHGCLTGKRHQIACDSGSNCIVEPT